MKCIFRVPYDAENDVFGSHEKAEPLAYIELFKMPPPGNAPIQHGYHIVKPDYYLPSKLHATAEKKAVVFPVSLIVRSCQLGPVFTEAVNRSWRSENILDVCLEFFVLNHLDNESFKMIF